MSGLLLVPAKTEWVLQVADNLRIDDLRELEAVHGAGVDPRAILTRLFEASAPECMIALTMDGDPVAAFGAVPLSLAQSKAAPWMLGTDGLRGYNKDIVSAGRATVLGWGCLYEDLENFVDARSIRSVAWLKRIGFTLHEPKPFGAMQLPFHRFSRCA